MEIVEKKWGTEVIICNNELYAAKLLEVEEGAICSWHGHPVKDETFYCLSGRVWLRVDSKEVIVTPGSNPVRVPPGTLHQFEGLESSTLLEVSTPHSDDDVERLSESMSAEERRATQAKADPPEHRNPSACSAEEN